DRVLGEKLGIVDPQDFSDLETLRAEVVSLIDDHLAETRSVPRVMFGQPFYFMQSHVLEIQTGVKVRTLAEFRDALAQVDTAVVYLHVVEARGRKGRRRNDFAAWIDEQLGLPELAAAVSRPGWERASTTRSRAARSGCRTSSSSSSAPSRAPAPRPSTPPPTWS